MKLSLTKKNKDRGFALLLSIIIASVVLAIGVSILKISVSQLQLSSTGRESEVAFQASQSIAECLTYNRYRNVSNYAARPGTAGEGTQLNAPPLNCMGSSPVDSYAEVVENREDRHIVKFHYTYSWGDDPELCSSGDMYVWVPLSGGSDGQSHTFRNTSVGEFGNGLKYCQVGSICTVLITQGYNRPCNQLSSSIFTLQRELTTEF